MWVSKTPLRASFLGGGTDYPAYFQDYPGAVLGGTIDKFIYIQALPLSPIAPERFRVTYRATESVSNIADIQHPVVRASLEHYNWSDPLNIATMSDLPGSTGLGSSSAFTVGFINLLHKMRGQELTRYELARQAIYMEQKILHENVGVQDQIHAAFGGLARYEFHGDSFTIEPLRLSTGRMNVLNESLLLVYTGGVRSASTIVAHQDQRTRSGANADYLRTMYEMTRLGVTCLEEDGDDRAAIVRFSELLDQGWKLKRQLGDGVTSSTIDDVYLRGKDLGAWGGKLLGAGGAGFVLFLVHPDLHDTFSKEFGSQNVIPVSLTNGGSTVTQLT